jgi:hypothetical protein
VLLRRARLRNVQSAHVRWQRKTAGLALAILFVAGVWFVAWMLRLDTPDRDLWLDRWANVLGIVGASVALALWLIAHTHGRHQKHHQNLDDLLSSVAQLVKAAWEKQASQRGLAPNDGPVPVRWAVDFGLSRLENVYSGPPAFAALPGTTGVPSSYLHAGGGRAELFSAFSGLPSGRLVITGPAGSGKTAAAIHLLQDLLAHREQFLLAHTSAQEIPIPVLYSLNGWDPDPDGGESQDVVQFVAAKLAGEFPSSLSKELSTELLLKGRFAVFLDGLDELPARKQVYAINALNRATFRIVLLSRRSALEAIARKTVLRHAAVLELQPLDGGAAAAYLRRGAPTSRATWDALARRLSRTPSDQDPLVSALRRPFFLSIAREIYTGGGSRDISELSDSAKLGTVDEIHVHLLDAWVDHAYAPVPGVRQRYDAKKARETLTLLAGIMSLHHSRDFRWWEVRYWDGRFASLPQNPKIPVLRNKHDVIPTTTKVSVALLCGFTGGLVGGLAGAVIAGFVGGAVMATMEAMDFRTAPLSDAVLKGFVLSIPSGLAGVFGAGLKYGLSQWSAVGAAAAAGLAGSLTLLLIHRLLAANAEVHYFKVNAYGPDVLWRNDRRASLTPLFFCMLGAAIAPASLPGPSLAAGLFVAVVYFIKGWLNGIVVHVFIHIDVDALAAVFWLVLGGVGILLAAALATGGWGMVATTVSLLVLMLAPALRFPPAWRAVDIAWRRAARSKNVARSLMPFLADAYLRGVLRAVGPAYQFRHALLQDHLAAEYGRQATSRQDRSGS